LFGDYQDALSTCGWRLFHSLLSFALNVKMLNPREVIAAAETSWRQDKVPLAAAEGFIWQILGWREYVQGHEPRLRGNHRLSMVYRNWDKMSAEAQQALRQQAEQTLAQIASL